MSRSRSSMRCETNGCSVPSSSSGTLSPVLKRAPYAEARGGRKRATRAAPDCAFARMPLRCLYHCGVAPRFRRQFFFGCRYSGGSGVRPLVLTAVGRQRRTGLLPGGVEIGAGLVDLARDGLLDVLGRVLELRLHLLQLFELDRSVHLGLDIGDVALRLADEVPDGARDPRQLLGPDDDERHGTDQRDLVEAEVDHAGASGAIRIVSWPRRRRCSDRPPTCGC